MNRHALYLMLAAAALLCSCQSGRVRIEGRIVGADDRQVYLERITPLARSVVDSAAMDEGGNYRFDVRGVAATPMLYDLICDGERIPLYLSGGDRLTVNSVGSVVRNYTVAGSEESELLRRFYQPFVAGLQRLDSIASTPGGQPLTQEQRQTMAREYTREYRRIKREQFRFIIENKSSLAAVYALNQRLPGDRYLFNLQSDAIYYRTVADALAARYPESPYLTTLTSEIARLDARLNLSSSIAETGYPDLELPDMYGRKVRLSSLRGKVILVDFWSAESGNSNALNADLKVLYDRFRDRGFEVYQVSADTSKPDWIASVQEQGLPWVSVCDFRGEASPAMGLYNVRQLPTNFLIDRSGVVVDRDLYGDRLEKRLAELL